MSISDFCVINPCLNGATCAGYLGGRTCTCVSGYSGIDCETSKTFMTFIALLQVVQSIQTLRDGLGDLSKLLNHDIKVKLSLAFVLGLNIGSYRFIYPTTNLTHTVAFSKFIENNEKFSYLI